MKQERSKVNGQRAKVFSEQHRYEDQDDYYFENEIDQYQEDFTIKRNIEEPDLEEEND